jgi:Flp pilus assembly protein TadG
MIRRRMPHHRAHAAVELAALLPFIVFLAVIGTDWARLFYYTIAIEGCARAGALYASDSQCNSTSTPYANYQAAALASAPSLSPTPTVTKQSVTVDGRPGVQVTVTINFTTITNFPGVPKSETLTRKVAMRLIPDNPD